MDTSKLSGNDWIVVAGMALMFVAMLLARLDAAAVVAWLLSLLTAFLVVVKAVPGAKLLLPLGVDEGVKVNRMINQRTVSTGVVFKDEVSEYTVTIEIANHRRHPIRVEVEDQLPVTKHKDTKVEGFEASPAMSGPELDGKVTYKGTVGAGSVQKLVIKFRIVRPKNWELRQHDH